ncbi:hypothetical protein C8Q76DRAFT_183870 [Earliella scabrosa]|nr:hypothetical protein C8Q76DRAFT_183870 [Earliella scabrosa]
MITHRSPLEPRCFLRPGPSSTMRDHPQPQPQHNIVSSCLHPAPRCNDSPRPNKADAKTTRHLQSITISEYSTIHTTTTEDARTDAQNGRPRAIYRYRTSHDDDDKSDAHEALYILCNTAEVAVGERARRAADDNGTTRRRRRRDREGSGRVS